MIRETASRPIGSDLKKLPETSGNGRARSEGKVTAEVLFSFFSTEKTAAKQPLNARKFCAEPKTES